MDFKKSATEKFLFGSVIAATLLLFVTAFSQEVKTNISSAEEGSMSSASGDDTSSKSEDSGGSEESEESDESVSEASIGGGSESSVPPVRRIQGTGVNTTELSDQSASEMSQESMGEVSEVSASSHVSEERSEVSVTSIEGYGKVVSREGNIAVVKKNEKFFFLIPVEIESRVTVDEEGTVVDSQQSFLNWILSVFSF